MRKFVEILTDDQIEQLKNCYLVTEENELYKLTQNEGDELTAENLKILVKGEKGFLIATVEHICFYEPEDGNFDFKVMSDSKILDYFYRECAPERIVKFLDQYLNKSQYEDKK